MDFFVRNIFQKSVKFARRQKKSLVSKYLGKLNKKKLWLFEKSLMTMEFLRTIPYLSLRLY